MRRAVTSAAPAALGICLVVSPQLLGGAYGWGISIIAALAGTACLLASWAARSDGLKAPLDLPSAALFACVAWTVLQAVPLPRGLTGGLQPEAVELADTAAALIDAAQSSSVPLSISPGSTRAEIVKGAGTLAAFFAAWLLASLGHRRRVAQLAALSTLAMSLVALGHLAAGAERVFGLYEPVHASRDAIAPLVNDNHLSGFLAMGVPVWIGLALEEEERGIRIGYLTAAAVVGASALLSPSRGGVAALVCGVIAIGVLGLARRRGGEKRDVGTAFAAIGATAAAIAGLGLYVGAEALFRDFERGDASKVDLATRGLALSLEHPWFGVGRGAFSAAFVSENAQEVRFTHPENLLAQWTSELGLVVAVVVLAILAWAVLRGVAAARSWARLGAAGGLIAIIVHDLVDFALEMSGVAVVAAALLAIVIAPLRSSRSRPPREVRAWAAAAAAGGAALLAVASVGWRIDDESAFALQTRLTLLIRQGDRREFRECLRHAVRLHPAEPAFLLLGGAEATRHGDPRALAWLNRAMVRAPAWSSPHLETARYLASRGRATQAFLELRAAEERRAGSGTALAAQILEQRPEATGELVRISGTDAVGREFLNQVARGLPLQHEAGIGIDAHLARDGVPAARARQARRALAARDPQRALAVLEPVRDPRDATIQLLRAEAMIELGQPERAVQVLEGALRSTERPEAVLALRARAQAAAGDAEAMRATMEEIRARAGGRASGLAAAWVMQGRHEDQLGNHGAALAAFHQADRLAPESSGLTSAAAMLERMGDLGRAERTYAELCRRTGPESPACGARERVARRLAESRPLGAQPLGTP